MLVLNVAASLLERWEEWIREHDRDQTDADELADAARELRRRSEQAALRWRPGDPPPELRFEEEWRIVSSGIVRSPR